MATTLDTSGVSSDEAKMADEVVTAPRSGKGETSEKVIVVEDSDDVKPKVYHTGWRLHMLTAG